MASAHLAVVRFQARLLGSLKTEKIAHVDMASLLGGLGLGKCYDADHWAPPTAAVRELNHKIKTLVSSGAQKPFVYVDLRK